MENLASPIHLYCMFFGLWGKPEHPGETHADIGRPCKLQTERPPGCMTILAGSRSETFTAHQL